MKEKKGMQDAVSPWSERKLKHTNSYHITQSISFRDWNIEYELANCILWNWYKTLYLNHTKVAEWYIGNTFIWYK